MKRQYFAYLNRWGRLVIEPADLNKETEALQSPSVFKVFRFIEAESFEEAISEAGRRLQVGEGMVTFAGLEAGIK